jgi:hypothetical protein
MAVYMLLIVGDDAAYAALDEETSKQMYAGHYAFMDELNQAGVKIVAGAELDSPSGARTLHADGTVTDGPFAEAKEQVGGLYSIDVPTIEEALAWARKIPMLPGDKIEVRKHR